VRSAKFGEVGLAYKVVSATMIGNGALATPGIHMCPARVRGPAHVGGDKGTDVRLICRNGLIEHRSNQSGAIGSWVRFAIGPEDRFNVPPMALRSQLETIALQLSPDARGVGHHGTDFGFRVCLSPTKICASPNHHVTSFASTRTVRLLGSAPCTPLPPTAAVGGGGVDASEVLVLFSGGLVSEGCASVRSDVGDASGSVKKDLKAVALKMEHC
jgi:hypothetical protein